MTHESGSTSGDERPDPPPPPPPPPYGQPPTAAPGPYGVPPSGAHPVPYGQPTPHQNMYAGDGYPPGIQRHPDQRPGTVLAAAITTIVSTGLVLAVLLVGIVALLVARSSVEDEFSRGFGSDGGTVYGVIVLVLLLFLLWCIAAIVLAVLVLKRKNWARIALTVSSGLTIVLSLLAITGGASVLTLGAAIAVIVCLFVGGANDWFHREHLYSPPRPPQV